MHAQNAKFRETILRYVQEARIPKGDKYRLAVVDHNLPREYTKHHAQLLFLRKNTSEEQKTATSPQRPKYRFRAAESHESSEITLCQK